MLRRIRNMALQITGLQHVSGESTPLRGRSRTTTPSPSPGGSDSINPSSYPSRLTVMPRGSSGDHERSPDEGSSSRQLSTGWRGRRRPAGSFNDGQSALAGMTKSQVYALIAVCTMSMGSHLYVHILPTLPDRHSDRSALCFR